MVQKVIAYMTLGVDVSGLFSEMIMVRSRRVREREREREGGMGSWFVNS